MIKLSPFPMFTAEEFYSMFGEINKMRLRLKKEQSHSERALTGFLRQCNGYQGHMKDAIDRFEEYCADSSKKKKLLYKLNRAKFLTNDHVERMCEQFCKNGFDKNESRDLNEDQIRELKIIELPRGFVIRNIDDQLVRLDITDNDMWNQLFHYKRAVTAVKFLPDKANALRRDYNTLKLAIDGPNPDPKFAGDLEPSE